MKDGKLKKYKYILIVLSLNLMLSFSGCLEEETTIEETPPTTEQTIENFVVTETQDGKIKTILESESAIIDDNQKKAYLTLPKVKFYEDGKYTSILISESGEIDLATNDIKALGKCTVDTVRNEYLQTRDVSYNAKNKLISSDSDIKITRGKDVIYGKGFQSDTDLDNVVIKNERAIID
ncbi:MAG: LPS export ABC transporter periplasmic protein LptC [Endomicrobiaceae bacterium]|nr:LPS export ABC transporter periplasmic protein LptC [Endomicrobiaceae bacterium]